MTTDTARIILVPGFWLGAWAWDDVAARLREVGHDVEALTLPGLEPGDDPAAVTLEQQVGAVEAAMGGEGQVVLVAHSGGAIPATAALDRHVDRVARTVWVDTAPVVDGFAMDASFQGDALPLEANWDDELEAGSMRDLTDAQLAEFRRRAVPQPGATVRDAVALTDDRRRDVPATILCTAYSADEYRAYAEQGAAFLAGVLEHRALTMVDLPTGHWPMWSKPAELAAAIDAAAHS
ncbi:alpha/beta fold hydrolase [Agrococcus carbonis]|uniref:Pimeloyl-ACP methyl ester carboxylesterase n=1 Tax=Agrococcus carbonis TaxID=684552 RepID=A0A1H1LXD1_9MICO|nr:alpha/beta fold hydrolase [Agrococcus carbonis]SDR78459.1 Pimeloyl-ACP methyl ester carboxylesterase [Agrococcus carbonis]